MFKHSAAPQGPFLSRNAHDRPSRSRLSRPLVLLQHVAVGLFWLALAAPVAADVRLPALFTDNLVLQQGAPIHIWGWAAPNEQVTITFRKQKATLLGPVQGRWHVTLKPEKAGGPHTLTVHGNNQIQIQNVLVGEVWVCSGQSNMEWPLKRAFEPQADIANSANPDIRLFTVPKLKSDKPVEDIKAAWKECGPETTPDFSAVGYYFGRALQQARKVPVGLIHTSWGGSPAEVWMSDDVLSGIAEYKRDIVDAGAAAWQDYLKRKEDAQQQGKPAPGAPWRPSELYNGMIAPLIPYAIHGAIWYQGESNAGRAEQYRRLFPDMIRNWRRDWGHGDFTFLAVQLAPWDMNKKRPLSEITAEPIESTWAELREAQVHATEVLPNVGLAVITDVGDKDDIHPTRKAPVGERLALAARVIAYGDKTHGLSPALESVAFGPGGAVLTFKHVGPGLESRGGDLTGFAIAGIDRKFAWAQAKIHGKNQVVVSSPLVSYPVAVRYGWAEFPVVNLFSKDGLPASPFRTDDFPMITAPKAR